MTRENRIKEEDERQGLMVDFDVYDFINKIYDDFESRTCENCKYHKKNGLACWNINSTMYNHPFDIHSDFSCGDFERKDNV